MPDVIRLEPDRWAAGGDAIARAADGRVVFVSGAVPGDVVHATVTQQKKDFLRATTVSVEHAAPTRVQPACPLVAEGCGGCGWQHVGDQLSHKTAVVADALRRTGRLPDARVEPTGGVAEQGYRTTMRFAVLPDGRVGLRAANSHRVVPVPTCLVAHPRVNEVLMSLRVMGASEATVRVSHATGEVTVMPDTDRATVHCDVPVSVGEQASLTEVVAGVPLRVTARSFFQSGVQAAELLVSEVRAAAGDVLHTDEPVLDGYGGIGLFAAALPLHRAIVVESSPSACADARVNAPAADICETTFETWTPTAVPCAIVDPARAGLQRDGAAVVAATGAGRVVLVSCDPVAMARDVALLAEHGYAHRVTRVLDLFPHTHHTEAVTVLDR